MEETSGLIDRLAANAIGAFELSPDSSVDRIDVSESTTYRVDDRERPALCAACAPARLSLGSSDRVRARVGEALLKAGVVETARPLPARDGSRVVSVSADGLPEPRNVVLFEWLDGAPPDAEDMDRFAAWVRSAPSAQPCALVATPAGFTRLAWDCDQLIGPHGRAGPWRDALGMGREELALLTRLEETIRERLAAYGQGSKRYGLTHADLRIANPSSRAIARR